MKIKKPTAAIQFILLLLAGIFLIWLSFRKLDTASLIEQLRKGHYWICAPVLLISATGYYSRVSRWQILLQQAGEKCRKSSLYAALCMGYTVNFAVPRLGEITRCLVIRKTDGTRVDITLITIILERLIDTLTLFLLLFIAAISYSGVLSGFISNQVIAPLSAYADPFVLKMMLVAIPVSGIILFIMIKRSDAFAVVLRKYQPAFRGLAKTSGIKAFWLHTFIIWLCYFLMTYLWMFIFDESSGISWTDAFVVMVVGSIGRSVPIQGGGMGAYHFLVSQLLVIFGLSLVTGNALAIIIHGAQAVFTFAMGAGSYLWMLYDVKSRPLKT